MYDFSETRKTMASIRPFCGADVGHFGSPGVQMVCYTLAADWMNHLSIKLLPQTVREEQNTVFAPHFDLHKTAGVGVFMKHDAAVLFGAVLLPRSQVWFCFSWILVHTCLCTGLWIPWRKQTLQHNL